MSESSSVILSLKKTKAFLLTPHPKPQSKKEKKITRKCSDEIMFVSKRKDNRKIKGRPGKPQGSVKAER